MKKNGILTLLFAFIPGAGQMYQGYMKRGLSLMLMAAGRRTGRGTHPPPSRSPLRAAPPRHSRRFQSTQKSFGEKSRRES